MRFLFYLLFISIVYSQIIILKPDEKFEWNLFCPWMTDSYIAEGSGDVKVTLKIDINIESTDYFTFRLIDDEKDILLLQYNTTKYIQFYENKFTSKHKNGDKQFYIIFENVNYVNNTIIYKQDYECNPSPISSTDVMIIYIVIGALGVISILYFLIRYKRTGKCIY